ncbi:MAG: response regulator [Desulfopila sp.]|jgi:PAS domain S-box-containing protein|nr:response regulator [Desulfopila sp.]
MAEMETIVPRILVVDDEARIRDACTMVLENEGYILETADNGELGLQMIEAKHFDVILLDLMMPVISGLDVLPSLTERHPDTAVIVITGYATVEHSIEAMKKGAFDFIPKPFTPDQLRAVVAKSIKYTRALQDISDSKSRLRVMVNRLLDGVMTTDADKNIVLANPAFLNMVDYPEAHARGKAVAEAVSNEAIVKLIDEALAMPEDTISQSSCEITLQGGEGGKERIVSASCSPFRSRTGQILGTTTVLHDITAVKEMDRMKSDFVSMVSHEIRSPMNSLLAQIKIILDGLAGEVTPKQREILERASGKVNNLVELVSELLDLARIEAGMVGRQMEDLDLREMLEEQVVFHKAGAEQKDISITLEVEGDLPVITADRQGMEEVLTNLITNAVKYSPSGGSILINACREGDFISLQIRDTGYGIPEEDLAEIFNRFYRVKDKNTRTIHGTGLGLAIVKSIVDAHRGLIRVESKLEQGTTFTVLLPQKI